MSYKISAKNRRLKRTLESIISVLKFESLNITTPEKVVLIWAIFSIASIFMNWFDSYDSKIIWNWFSNLLWITWYVLFFLNLIVIFFILNSNQKENIKNLLNFNIKDWIFIEILMFFCLVLSINAVFLIQSFSFFEDDIILWKWIVFSIIWAIFWIIWAIFIVKTKTKVSIYIDWDREDISQINSIPENNKNNMKLPF